MTNYSATPGNPSIGQVLNSGDTLTVSSGGIATGAVVNSGASLYVYQYGSAASTTVNSGGFADFTGSATSVTDTGGRLLVDYGGGPVSFVTLSRGAGAGVDGPVVSMTISSGGNAEFFTTESAVTIDAGGSAYLVGSSASFLVNGGTLAAFISSYAAGEINFNAVPGGVLQWDVLYPANITISGVVPGDTIEAEEVYAASAVASLTAGDQLAVTGGGSSAAIQLDPTENYGGDAFVAVPGLGQDVLVLSQGLTVYTGQSSGGLSIGPATLLTVQSGGTVSSTTLFSGSVMTLSGLAVSTTVSSGFVLAQSGATATSATLSSAATGIVFSGASAVAATVDGGGYLAVSSGAVDVSATVNSGGSVYTYGTESSLTVNSSGSGYGYGAISAVTVNSGGYFADYGYTSGASLTNPVINGGTLLLEGDTLDGSVTFGPVTGGTLEAFQDFSNTISGFAVGDTIDVAQIYLDPFTYSAGVLTFDVFGGTDTLTFDLPSSITASNFVLVSGSTGESQNYVAITLACFRNGTNIATPSGGVAVEALREGDCVLAHRGDASVAAAPVRWIGCRVVDCARHPEPEAVWPVRIAAGAFGKGLPARDLFLSPDHALFLDDALVPVRYLINGLNVSQVKAETVSYYHIELDHHSVVFAEGLGAESFLDTGNKGEFSNGGVAVTLHPYFASRRWEAFGCAPLMVTGRPVERARARLERNWAAAEGTPRRRRQAG